MMHQGLLWDNVLVLDPWMGEEGEQHHLNHTLLIVLRMSRL